MTTAYLSHGSDRLSIPTKTSTPTKTMKDKTLALILFSLRELQCNIQYAPDQMLEVLRDYYQVNIATPEDLYADLEAIAQSLNSGDENVY